MILRIAFEIYLANRPVNVLYNKNNSQLKGLFTRLKNQAKGRAKNSPTEQKQFTGKRTIFICESGLKCSLNGFRFLHMIYL
jgi:hypothetical protein